MNKKASKKTYSESDMGSMKDYNPNLTGSVKQPPTHAKKVKAHGGGGGPKTAKKTIQGALQSAKRAKRYK